MAKSRKLLPPVHPGEILLEDFRKPLRLSVNRLALDLQVPATRIGEIVHRHRLRQRRHGARQARYFKTNPEFCRNLQTSYELELTRRSGSLSEIERHVHPFSLFSFLPCHKIPQTVPFSACTVLNFHSPFFFRSPPRFQPPPNPLQNPSLNSSATHQTQNS